ncbi:unnamed protein product [Haemonchus placei]|uniref:AA_permease_N domain-containing protein n=1 Tax=Haemonchus placei TaxID=6290 RepID=A0A0N4WZY3_HAEPC|nr:unnamed protein product [Haemonchus placei]
MASVAPAPPPPHLERRNTGVDHPPDLEFYRDESDQTGNYKRRPTIQELAANRLRSEKYKIPVPAML